MQKSFLYNKFIIILYMLRALCAHYEKVKIVLYCIRYHQIFRWTSGAKVGRELRMGRIFTGVMIPDAV